MNKTKIHISGLWMVFFAALFWSTNAPLVKLVKLDPIFVCGLRALIAGIALAPFIRPKQLEWNWWLVAYIISYCCLSLSVIISLKMTSAIIAVGMQYTGPLWLFVLAIIQKEKIDKRSIITICAITFGMMLFMLDDSKESNSIGNLLALTEGIFFAGVTLSSKNVGKKNPIGATAIANLATALIVFGFLPPKFAELLTIPGSQWPIMLFLGIFQVGIGYTLYLIGNKTVSPQKASIVALWEMILGPVWVAIFLKEFPSAIVITGLVIILCGLTVNSQINSNKSPLPENI